MDFFNLVFHVVCILMFVVGGIMSKGKLNVGALICTTGLVLLGLAYTGVIGSFLALFN